MLLEGITDDFALVDEPVEDIEAWLVVDAMAVAGCDTSVELEVTEGCEAWLEIEEDCDEELDPTDVAAGEDIVDPGV